MGHITIHGTTPLRGEITVQTAKNSVLPMLAATLLHSGCSCIRNCPQLSDVAAAAAILQHLGCTVRWDGPHLTVDAATVNTCSIPPALMCRCRASVLFLGALLGRCGEAEMSFPGGCALGPRPIDLHLLALRRLGAEIREEGCTLRARAGQLRGGRICLPFPSVGATENAMLAATAAEGVTVIEGAAREPEIVDLQAFLRCLGGEIRGAGTSCITVQGRRCLHDGAHHPIPDRIAAATYLCAAASAGGSITLLRCNYRHLTPVLTALGDAGCAIRCCDESVSLRAPDTLRAPPAVVTQPYPGFPTDAQPLLMAALLRAEGCTFLTERLFDNRFGHVPQLRKLGAQICLTGRSAAVIGVESLHGAVMEAADLRCGAALAVAALGAEGRSEIHNLHHILRGYEDLSGDLAALGAQICIQE